MINRENLIKIGKAGGNTLNWEGGNLCLSLANTWRDDFSVTQAVRKKLTFTNKSGQFWPPTEDKSKRNHKYRKVNQRNRSNKVCHLPWTIGYVLNTGLYIRLPIAWWSFSLLLITLPRVTDEVEISASARFSASTPKSFCFAGHENTEIYDQLHWR